MNKFFLIRVMEFESEVQSEMTGYDIYENALIAFHEQMAEAIGADGLKNIKVALLDANLYTMLYNTWENGTGANITTTPIPCFY